MLWAYLLRHLVKSGDLSVIDAGGKRHSFGVAGQKPKSAIRLTDKSLHHKLFFNPEFHIGEAYMNDTLVIEEGSLDGFMTLIATNLAVWEKQPSALKKFADAFTPVLQRLQQYNPVGRAAKNVAPHYDISDKLYELFLDKEMIYSCAYYADPANGLDLAQQDKLRHLAAKLRLEPGMKVLDVGCGWGALAIYLAKETGAEVTGVTLSGEQQKWAAARAEKEGLQDKVRFILKDIREVEGTFDRIVSVGMLEHVGVGFYKQVFEKVRDLLGDKGVGLFHFIGSLDGPCTTNPWLRKYIFPGGYSPALSEIAPVLEKTRLFMTDIEVLRLHYAYTLRDWHDRFQQNRAKAAALYDERFCRMWEFYLKMAEMEFLYLGTGVYQVQFAKDLHTLPLTRDYMTDWERRRKAA
ncbi:MAG: class I SAM-dependent methyltransferase [Alphaproteobacteria bacterium]|nr:cyclopropane-fatty-acyl-phospholipid synthase family protein [Alphaproteobacteria bacterium]MDE2337414.1 class I SAM-dependent methyltransferase [Alphaproteobacteria bacterium]